MSARPVLYHFAFDPASRVARLALGEAKAEWADQLVKPWEPESPVHALNPSGMPPVLTVGEGARSLALRELDAILGWIEDNAKTPLMLPGTPVHRAEARRLTGWFARRFADEVDAVLLHERMEKPLFRLGSPDARQLRAGRDALKIHLSMLEALFVDGRDWLAGPRLSQADFVAWGHLSVLDYFGEIRWGEYPGLKTWAMKLKSRPCARILLGDRFPGVAPSAHYADLDF